MLEKYWRHQTARPDVVPEHCARLRRVTQPRTAAASMTRPAGRSRARRRAIGLAVLALLTGITSGADGQRLDPTASTPAVQLFTGGRVIVGDGRVIEEAAFLVRDDLIVRVGSAGEVPAPPEARVVDLTGRTVMPALVNTHAHLGWEQYTSWGSENFTRENLIDHLHRHAYYGVGTVISTGSDIEEIALEVRQAQRLGEVEGARYLFRPVSGRPAADRTPGSRTTLGGGGCTRSPPPPRRAKSCGPRPRVASRF